MSWTRYLVLNGAHLWQRVRQKINTKYIIRGALWYWFTKWLKMLFITPIVSKWFLPQSVLKRTILKQDTKEF